MLRVSFGLALVILIAPLTGCGGNVETPGRQPVRSVADTSALAYRLDTPDAGFDLDHRLDEISGLTMLDAGLLGAVEDENGNLYVLDAATGEIVHTHDFGGDGDYEGVERVGERVVVLRSDGRLYGIEDWRAEKAKADHVETGLHASCDAEGLAHDAGGGRLLIACKEKPGQGLRAVRAIYAYYLASNALDPRPAFVIHPDTLTHSDGDIDAAVRSFVRPIADLNAFKPSALAVHPVTGEVYVLSSVRKLLVVLSRGGAVTAVWPLPERRLPQPEGLAFLPDGTLFIASEAGGGSAVLLRYSYRPTP